MGFVLLCFVCTVFCLFGAKCFIQITLSFSLCCDSVIHLLLHCFLFVCEVEGFNILRHFRKTGHQIEVPVRGVHKMPEFLIRKRSLRYVTTKSSNRVHITYSLKMWRRVEPWRWRRYILRVQPTRCNFSQFIYSCKTLYMFQTFFCPSSGAQNCTYSVRHLSDHYCYLLLASRLAAGNSNGLTNAWRCMCSFELLMMDGKKSETCRASYRNK